MVFTLSPRARATSDTVRPGAEEAQHLVFAIGQRVVRRGRVGAAPAEQQVARVPPDIAPTAARLLNRGDELLRRAVLGQVAERAGAERAVARIARPDAC